jgi:phenylacetic acid degradation operon negative regulatory protein
MKAMSRHPLSRIIRQFKREPSRTGSLIITFHGDAIVPRGGSVWLGSLLRFLELLGTDGGVVRTAVSRLAADGWLEREKIGRKSYYALAPRGRERFEAAVEHVYNPHSSDEVGQFELLLIENAADRERARPALTEAGFGNPFPGVWVAPPNAVMPSVAAGAIRLHASAEGEMGRRLVAASWSLERIAEGYRNFIKTFEPLADGLRGGDVAPDEAILSRVLLIHHYRRVVLRDPLLPGASLPAEWPAAEARRLCAALYRALLPASEQWLGKYGENQQGALPPPGAELRRRFSDVPVNMLQK